MCDKKLIDTLYSYIFSRRDLYSFNYDEYFKDIKTHYNNVISSTMASQITSLTIFYSSVYSGTDQRKQQRSASLAFVRGIHRWVVDSLHRGPVARKMFPFDDVIMDFRFSIRNKFRRIIPFIQSRFDLSLWSASNHAGCIMKNRTIKGIWNQYLRTMHLIRMFYSIRDRSWLCSTQHHIAMNTRVTSVTNYFIGSCWVHMYWDQIISNLKYVSYSRWSPKSFYM